MRATVAASASHPPLSGIDEISIAANATLKFEHPTMSPLYIHSGANSIKWAYHLNTQSTPTIGGEVVQVLSALVGPITISGQTAGLKTNVSGKIDHAKEVKGWRDIGNREAYTAYDELREILKWFRSYMTRAGSLTRGQQKRDEAAIKFTYAERGWQFYLQPTKLDGFRYDAAVISPEWGITAEVVSDNALDYFGGVTMGSFTDDLITNQQLLGQMGLSAFASSGTEKANPNFGQSGDFGSNNPFLNPAMSASGTNAARIMGDNFKGLVAAWATGDFAHFGFGSLLDNGFNKDEVDATYASLFGTTFAGSQGGATGSGTGNAGSTVYNNGANPVTKDQIILDIVTSFEAVGIPGRAPIAVVMDETGSSFNPDDRQPDGDFAMGLFQTFPGGKGGDYSKAALTKAIDNKSDPVTKYYPVGQQISDAVKWWVAALKLDFPGGAPITDEGLAQFAAIAQGHQVDDGYDAKILSRLSGAQGLITAAKSGVNNNQGAVPVGTLVDLAKQLLGYHGTKWIDDNFQGLAQIQATANGEKVSSQAGGSVFLNPKTIQAIIYLINQGYTIGTYAWCSDHHNDGLAGHAGGNAVDVSSINGVFINHNADNTKALVLATGKLMRNGPAAVIPRQLISGGYGNHPDAQCTALCLPSAQTYDAATLYGPPGAGHTNHMHLGY